MDFVDELIANPGTQLVDGLTAPGPVAPDAGRMLLVDFLHQSAGFRCGLPCSLWLGLVGCVWSARPLHIIVADTMRRQGSDKLAIAQDNCLVHAYLYVVLFAERLGDNL